MKIGRYKLKTHFEYLFAALWMSGDWYLTWLEWRDSKDRHERKVALYAKARAMVLFDRLLNGEVRE